MRLRTPLEQVRSLYLLLQEALMATGAGPHLPIDVEFPEDGQGQWDGNQGDENTYAQTHRGRDKHRVKEGGSVPTYPIRYQEGDL